MLQDNRSFVDNVESATGPDGSVVVLQSVAKRRRHHGVLKVKIPKKDVAVLQRLQCCNVTEPTVLQCYRAYSVAVLYGVPVS